MELLAVALVALWFAVSTAVGLLVGRVIHLRDAVRPTSAGRHRPAPLRLVV